MHMVRHLWAVGATQVAASKLALGGLGAAAVVAAGFEFGSHIVDVSPSPLWLCLL